MGHCRKFSTALFITVKPVLGGHSKEDQKIGFQNAYCRSKVLQNYALLELSALLLTFIKLPFVFKTFVFANF